MAFREIFTNDNISNISLPENSLEDYISNNILKAHRFINKIYMKLGLSKYYFNMDQKENMNINLSEVL